MKDSQDRWFDTCVERLADPLNQRVWSIIVSLFGDHARGPGDRLSGTALSRVIGPIGIRPEAIRVAVHRLRKDGWLLSERAGRESQHYLTDFGREQSDSVSPRIYTREPSIAKDWHVVIAEESSGLPLLDDLMLTENYVSIGRNVALGAGGPPAGCDDLLVFRTTPLSVPRWLRNRVCPPELNDACRDLARDSAAVTDILKSDPEMTPLQIATLRTLTIHRWRRVVLRYPDLPTAFFPANWRGEACRAQVFRLLDRLPRPSPQVIEEACSA